MATPRPCDCVQRLSTNQQAVRNRVTEYCRAMAAQRQRDCRATATQRPRDCAQRLSINQQAVRCRVMEYCCATAAQCPRYCRETAAQRPRDCRTMAAQRPHYCAQRKEEETVVLGRKDKRRVRKREWRSGEKLKTDRASDQEL